MSAFVQYTAAPAHHDGDWLSYSAAVAPISPRSLSFDDEDALPAPPFSRSPSVSATPSPPLSFLPSPVTPSSDSLASFSVSGQSAPSRSCPTSPPLSCSAGSPDSPDCSALTSTASLPESSEEVRAVAAVAVVVPEDGAVVEKLRHRAIDKRRRLREASALTQLASLLQLPAAPPSRHKRHRFSASASSAKAPERVALLEAAAARLQALEHSVQRQVLQSSQALGDPLTAVGCIGDPHRVTFAAMAAESGKKVAFKSVYSGIPLYEQFTSRTWLQIVGQLEAAYQRGDVSAEFGIDFGTAVYWPDMVGASSDPRCAACMRGLYALLRGDVSSVMVEFATWHSGAAVWVDTKAMAWIVPHSGVRRLDRPLSTGKLLVFASRMAGAAVHRTRFPSTQRPLPLPDWC